MKHNIYFNAKYDTIKCDCRFNRDRVGVKAYKVHFLI